MANSLEKVVKQKDHKERGQLASRAKFGLLEKHKDYVLRARDYNTKQRRLKTLQQKARDRNPDEFYFKMINTKTADGVHRHLRSENDTNGGLGGKLLKVLRTQDQNYVNMIQQVNKRQISKLESNLQMIHPSSKKSNHTIFVDSVNEAESFDAAKHFNTLPALVEQPQNRQTVDNLRKQALSSQEVPVLDKKVEKEKLKLYKSLLERLEREKHLSRSKKHADLQKTLLGKGARKKVGEDSDGIPIYKWRPERSR